MKYLKIFVAPPGAGKSTLAQEYVREQYVCINQDSQGKEGHMSLFKDSLDKGRDIVVDRMNFSKEQRQRYIEPARSKGYHVEIIVLHENRETCLDRCLAREGHETIKDAKGANNALNTFFSKYERPTEDEADLITFRYPEIDKPNVVICDLDGTLCDISHRQHFVTGKEKKNWTEFFRGIPNDKVNGLVADTINLYRDGGTPIVYCSGRDDNQRKNTETWLDTHFLYIHDHLFMRPRNDYRSDEIIKEIILDFEIKTRYNPILSLDDRDRVVAMWRRRGVPCFQVNYGDF